MRLKKLRWFAIYLALRLLMLPFVVMPPRLAIPAGRMLGALLYRLLGKWRRTGIETVSAALPYLRSQPSWGGGSATAEEIIRELFANIGILVAEVSRLYFGNYQPLLATVEFRGVEHFENARNKGCGVIGVAAHSGNWELMAAAVGASISPLAVVARTMKTDYLDRMLEQIRSRHGNSVIYRENGVKGMFAVLKANGFVGILPDQMVKPPHAIPVDFLGTPAWTSIMPVKLALKTGSPILPFFAHREGDRTIVTIHPPLELLASGSDEERILDGTRKMNRAIEEHVLRYPSQWNWLYRRWKGAERIPAWLKQHGVAACKSA
jgi:KDO2-lipid IV(A) lauroyltransferase